MSGELEAWNWDADKKRSDHYLEDRDVKTPAEEDGRKLLDRKKVEPIVDVQEMSVHGMKLRGLQRHDNPRSSYLLCYHALPVCLVPYLHYLSFHHLWMMSHLLIHLEHS